jgi:two-component system, cell cycle response regulator
MDKILLVDDVKLLLEKKKGLLASSRVHILTASDGHEALAIARKESPKLIVMDNNLSNMDGISCCRVIKTDPHLSHIPVVMLANFVQLAAAEGHSSELADDWIPNR